MRSRLARTSLAALAVALPLLIGGAARAAEPESGEEVVFSGGGLLGVACGAKPSVGSISVPAESTLRVVNQTGYRAKLIMDGAVQGEVGKGEAAKVLFHRGPVTLALKPNCVLTEESASVRVSVRSPVRAAPPAERPAAESPDVATPLRDTPGARTPGSDRRPDAPPARPAPVTSSPSFPINTPGGTTESAPTPAPATPEPALSGLPDPLALPLEEGPGDTPAGLAAEPVAAVGPVEESGPVGLLALIATICVIGVSAGAIRAIIAQRAARIG